MYIWQPRNWPRFTWDEKALKVQLDAVRMLQGRLLGRAESVPREADLQMEMDTVIQNAIRTSEIEGEHLDVESVRSSVVRQLGLERAGLGNDRPTDQSEALVALLLEATREHEVALTPKRLCQWQAMLFPGGAVPLSNVRVGELRGEQVMQVISGRIDRRKVHFEAPPRDRLEAELNDFLDWFNQPPAGLDPLLRAGIAHLWLVTLHPFDDGNGRVTRAVTDRALAQAEQQSIRFYSLSTAIMARRQDYYDRLEQAQKGDLDITEWLGWFLDVLKEALQQSLARLDKVLDKSRFWQRHATTVLNARQIKVLNRLLDTVGKEFEFGINAAKYKSIAKVSKATATRDLSELMEKGCLRKLPGGGRSTRYVITQYPSQPLRRRKLYDT